MSVIWTRMAFLKPDLRMVNAWPRLPSHHAVCRCRRSWPWFLPGRPCPACQPAGDVSGGNSSQGTPAALVGGHLRRQGPHVCQKTVTGSVAPSEHPSWPLQTSLVLLKRLCVRAGIGTPAPREGFATFLILTPLVPMSLVPYWYCPPPGRLPQLLFTSRASHARSKVLKR